MKAMLALLAAFAGGWLLLNLLGALVTGAIARALLPGKDKVGWFTTIAVGFVGGILGKIVAWAVGWRHLNWVLGFCVSVVGAMALLIVHRLTVARPAATPAAPKP
jgi:uncharacterized membrane protein YeaQ/YmgE (transglycosylase-associated protein family)